MLVKREGGCNAELGKAANALAMEGNDALKSKLEEARGLVTEIETLSCGVPTRRLLNEINTLACGATFLEEKP